MTTSPIVRPIDAFEFMRLLWALDHALQSRSKRMLSTLGVTGPQRLVVRAVGRQPQISAGELATLLHLHPSTLTGVLSRLVEGRLLARSGDPRDSRRALFQLTTRGRKVDELNSGTVEAAIRRVLGRQPASRLSAAGEVLAALATELARPDTLRRRSGERLRRPTAKRSGKTRAA
jgi:MarR family transcriptional regulator, organic hydroperoxide resistance regulator